MSELPPIAGRQVVKALGKIGYELDRQRGSHRKFGSETPSFYDGFTVKYEHRLHDIC